MKYLSHLRPSAYIKHKHKRINEYVSNEEESKTSVKKRSRQKAKVDLWLSVTQGRKDYTRLPAAAAVTKTNTQLPL
ncbi:hypothetical protein EYF80_040174 [Liparis tanakae]|uniref:Uncharacterized protein n=1 Tax=Liparis tanakae TaxID=230148 RepID=A0A4Z2G7Q7_9TELE|nr:hypothetical protein EYF80_040174 [Liparis tanakae]